MNAKKLLLAALLLPSLALFAHEAAQKPAQVPPAPQQTQAKATTTPPQVRKVNPPPPKPGACRDAAACREEARALADAARERQSLADCAAPAQCGVCDPGQRCTRLHDGAQSHCGCADAF